MALKHLTIMTCTNINSIQSSSLDGASEHYYIKSWRRRSKMGRDQFEVVTCPCERTNTDRTSQTSCADSLVRRYTVFWFVVILVVSSFCSMVEGKWLPENPTSDFQSDQGNSKELEKRTLMLSDSPFSNENLGNVQWQDPEFRKNNMSPTSIPAKTTSDPKFGEYEKNYKEPGSSYVQIFHSHTMSYLQVDPTNGKIGITSDSRSNNTFFVLSYLEKNVFMENVQTCLFLCLARNGIFYTKTHLDKDEACKLRFHHQFLSKVVQIGGREAIKSFHNETHNLLISVMEKTNPGRTQKAYKLKSEWVPNGMEREDHFFEVSEVGFDLLHATTSKQLLPTFHKNGKRKSDYCPVIRLQQDELFRQEALRKAADHKHDNSTKKGVEFYQERYWRCANFVTLDNRTHCRNQVRIKCKESLGDETCNVILTNKTPKDAKNCASLNSRSDRKMCRRHKRKVCHQKLELLHPKWPRDKIVKQCKDMRKKFMKCVNRTMKKKKAESKNDARKICKKKVNKFIRKNREQ